MPEGPTDFRLFEPASPEALLPDSAFPLGWIVFTTAFIVAAAVTVYLIRRKRAVAEEDPERRREAAFQKAREELRRSTPATSREAGVECSLILRRYLADALADPSLYETHEEFITRGDSMLRLSDSAREAGGAGFQRLAALKYAPEIPDVPPGSVVTESDSLLEILHRGLKA